MRRVTALAFVLGLTACHEACSDSISACARACEFHMESYSVEGGCRCTGPDGGK